MGRFGKRLGKNKVHFSDLNRGGTRNSNFFIYV